MPDVGVLNLQIRDNSMQAAQGLSRLANVLKSIKASTTGLRLASVATGISKIQQSVAKINNSDLQKLKILTSEIQKLQAAAGSVNGIRISFGSTKAGGSASSGAMEQAQVIRDMAQDASTAMESVGQRIQQANEQAERFAAELEKMNALVRNLGWTAGDASEKLNEMFMAMNLRRMSSALGSGEPILSLMGGGVAPENALSTYVQEGDAWKPDWTFGENFEPGFQMLRQHGEEVVETVGTIKDEFGNTIAEISDAASSMGRIASATAETADGFHDIERSTESVRSKIDGYNEAIEFARKWNESGTQSGGYGGQEAADIAYINDMIKSASEADLLSMRIDSLRDKLYQMASSGKASGDQIARMVSQIQSLQGKLDAASESADGVRRSLSEIMIGSNGLDGALKRMFPTISKLLSRFKQLVKYRMLRAVIKQISEGFREGYENYYHYSDAIGGEFAKNMDAATSSLAQMKNSIGAAAAPLINSLIPYLQVAVHWFIEVVNYANQFVALLRGQSTWSRATTQNVKAFEKTGKAAKGASSAMKDLLADWDELNIIQSQGGGGSGTAATGDYLKDYESMFEEVNNFDDNIKDAIKFIEDHLGGIPGILKKAGAILLGWKLSKAFGGLIGALGEIIAGGAIVTLGVELAYGGGFEAGTKGYFDTKDLIASVAGTVATALGGSLITTAIGVGGGAGFVIGLTAGLIVTLVGWVNGQADMYDRLKWGNREMTPEQIKNYVASKFSFDVNAEIELLGANIKNREAAEAALTTAVNTFTSNLTFATMKVGIQADDAETALTEAYKSANKVIEEIQSYIDTNEKSLYTTLSVSPIKDSKGNDVTSNILESVTIADETLKSYFVGLGKELADAMYEGEKDGWTEGEMEAVLALMERQRNIVAKAEEMQRDITFEMNYRFNLNNLTRDNAKEISDQQQAIINDYKETFMKDRQTALAAAIKELAWAQAALDDAREKGLDTTDLENAVKTYQSLINDYMDPQKAEEDWNVKMSESMANMREDWLKALRKNYGIMEEEFEWDHNPFTYKLPNTILANDVLDAAQMGDPVGQATKALKKYFDVIKKEQPDYIRDIMSSLNIGVWDITNDTIKKNLVAMLRENLGNDDWAAMVLQNAGVSVDEIEKLFGDGYEYLPEGIQVPVELSPEAASFEIDAQAEIGETGLYDQLKQEVEDAMKDGFMSTDEAFDLMTRYGWQEYENAMKELQYNLDEYGANRGMVRPMGVLASAGTSDVGFARRSNAPDSTFTLQVEPGDNQQEVNNTANGVQIGTDALLNALNSILSVAQAINRKPFVVNLVPTSGLGRTVAQGAAAFSRVTGVDR